MRCSFCVLRVHSIVSDYVLSGSGSVHTAKPKAHLALRNWKRETERRGRGERLGKADDHVKGKAYGLAELNKGRRTAISQNHTKRIALKP